MAEALERGGLTEREVNEALRKVLANNPGLIRVFGMSARQEIVFSEILREIGEVDQRLQKIYAGAETDKPLAERLRIIESLN